MSHTSYIQSLLSGTLNNNLLASIAPGFQSGYRQLPSAGRMHPMKQQHTYILANHLAAVSLYVHGAVTPAPPAARHRPVMQID